MATAKAKRIARPGASFPAIGDQIGARISTYHAHTINVNRATYHKRQY